MKKSLSLLILLFSVLLGLMFLFSAYTKTQPIAYFEYSLQSQLHFSKSLAGFAARFFIGLEAALGFLLLFNIFGKRNWVVKTSIVLLVMFILHLIILLFTQGNDVNCGCMGSLIPMSPTLSIIKNVVILLMLRVLLLNKRQDQGLVISLGSSVFVLLLIVSAYIIFPLSKPVTLPLDLLYHDNQVQAPPEDLTKGKHIVAFVTLTCPHCRDAAKKLREMKEENPVLPIIFIIPNGEDSTRTAHFHDFMIDTKAENIAYSFVRNEYFGKLVKESGNDAIPIILWMEDATIIRQVTVRELNVKEAEIWYSK